MMRFLLMIGCASALTNGASWKAAYTAKVVVDEATLDAAFLGANGAAIDAKVAAAVAGTGVDAATAKAKLTEKMGELGILQTDVKKLKAAIAPPPPPPPKKKE